MLSVSPGISNQLFAAIDADKGDDTDQNHCAGGAEADDVFQILRAIFFETHFFVSTVKFFSAAKLVMCVHYFFAATGKRVRVIFIPDTNTKSTSNFCGIFGDSHLILPAGVAAESPPSDRKRLLSRGKLRSRPDGEREC